jgi:hypothetical protein
VRYRLGTVLTTPSTTRFAGFLRRVRASSVREFGVGLTAVLLLHHFGFWALLGASRGIPLVSILSRWDAEHYSAIATHGYSGTLWAFFPLVPALMSVGAFATHLPPVVIGTIVSSGALLAFVLVVTSWEPGSALAPSKAGLFLILYGPASFALHSAHTESVFLLFSALALSGALRARWFVAAAFAGLAMWTRLPGVFLGFTVLFLLASKVRAGALTAGKLVAAALVMSGAGLAFLGFQYLTSGSVFAFLESVNNRHAVSALDVLRTFWLGNPWQNTSAGSIQRHVWFIGLLVASLRYVRTAPVLGGYAVVSLTPFFAQAEFVNAFRHPLVLFPLWFWLGHQLERAPRWLQLVIVVGIVWLNHLTTKRYALGLWSY